MELTKTAMAAFEAYFDDQYPEISTENNGVFNIPYTALFALYIEFFDSVGINIFIEHTQFSHNPRFEGKINTHDDFILLHAHHVRYDAVEECIIKANEIYDEKIINSVI